MARTHAADPQLAEANAVRFEPENFHPHRAAIGMAAAAPVHRGIAPTAQTVAADRRALRRLALIVLASAALIVLGTAWARGLL